MGTLVKAIAAGFANGQRIRPGKVFTLPDGVKPGKWMEVVKTDVPAKGKAETAADAKAAAEAKKKADAAELAKKNAENRNIKPADDLA